MLYPRFLLCIALIIVSPMFAHAQVAVGLGLAPIHQSGQTDFSPIQMPYDIYIMYKPGQLGIRLDYQWHAAYRKENFTTTNIANELSLVYYPQHMMRIKNLQPFLRVGVVRWITEFTTEGYPGINDYTLKVEKDRGFGCILAGGLAYALGSFTLGLEGQYVKKGNAQFIAGGFEPQNLLNDQFKLLLTIHYTLPFANASRRRNGIPCPTF